MLLLVLIHFKFKRKKVMNKVLQSSIGDFVCLISVDNLKQFFMQLCCDVNIVVRGCHKDDNCILVQKGHIYEMIDYLESI